MPTDQEMGNWWTSNHPDSKFRKNLIVALLNRDGTRRTLVNIEFLHRRSTEILEQIEIRSREQMSVILRDRFGLELPAIADLSSLFSGNTNKRIDGNAIAGAE